MFYKIFNNVIAIQTTQLINATRNKHALIIHQFYERPSYRHYSFYLWIIQLCNAMSSILVEAKALKAFKVKLAKQNILAISNY